MLRPVEIALGLLMLVGSVLGIVGFLLALLQGSIYRFPGELIVFGTVALYSAGIWSGWKAIRRDQQWVKVAQFFWLAQVPAISSSAFSVLLSCGVGAWVFLQFGGSQIGASASAHLGSAVHWSYEQYKPVSAVGLNVVAFLIAGYLFAWQPPLTVTGASPSEA